MKRKYIDKVRYLYHFFKGRLKLRKQIDLSGRVVVMNLAKWGTTRLYTEVLIAAILSKNNAKVFLLIDDRGYLNYFTNNKVKKPSRVSLAYSFFLCLLGKILSVRFLKYSELLPKVLDKDKKNLSDADNKHIYSHLVKIFETDDKEIIEKLIKKRSDIYEKVLHNCFISKSIGVQVKNKLDPDLFITSHGIYTYYGPSYSYLRESGINCLIYAHHPILKGIMFSETPFQIIIDDRRYKDFIDKKQLLSSDENEVIEKYFIARAKKDISDTKIYFQEIDSNSLNPEFKDGINFGIFPNIIWDGNIPERHTIFNGYIDWIKYTLECISQSEHNFVIRFHPSEATMFKDSKKFYDVLTEYHWFANLPDNLQIIKSDDKIDTYDLLNNIDIGIVYDGTIAGELVFMDKPAICCGYGRCADPKWGFLPKDKDEYKTWLNSGASELLTRFRDSSETIKIEMKKNYYYYSFFNNCPVDYIKSIRPRIISAGGFSITMGNPENTKSFVSVLSKYL